MVGDEIEKAADFECPAISPEEPQDFIFIGQPVQRLYVLETFMFDPDLHLDYLTIVGLLTGYEEALKARSWTLCLDAFAFTGAPGAMTRLWTVPAGLSLDQELIEMRKLQEHRDLLNNVLELRREVLYPMPYSPSVAQPPQTPANVDARARTLEKKEEAPIVLLVRATAKKGALSRLSCLKGRFFKPRVEQPDVGWKLIAAGSSLTGAAASLVQLWMLPSFNALGRAMSIMDDDPTYTEQLRPCIQKEEQDAYGIMFIR